MVDITKMREGIKQAIEDNIDSVAEVHAYEIPLSEITSWPAITLIPGNSQAEYGSNKNDKQTFNFSIAGFYKIDEDEDHADSQGVVGDCMSEIINLFTGKEVLKPYLSREECEAVEPTPSSWQPFSGDDGSYIAFTVDVSLRVRVGNNM